MQYVRLIGGLGNQLFQYAFALNLKKKNTIVKLDANSFKVYKLHPNSINKFNLKIQFANWKEVKKFYLFKSNFISIKLLEFSKTIYSYLIKIFISKYIFERSYNYKNNYKYKYFHGYWQNLKFLNKKHKILKSLKLKKYSRKHLKLIKEIKNKKNSVAIHFRYYPKKFQRHYINLDLKYYDTAIKKIKNKIKKPYFYIFSNDISKIKKRISLTRINYKIINNFEDFEDLISIAKCKNQIISNSTFSFWAAWLNKNNSKIVIAPKRWFLNNYKDIDKSFMPSKWIKI
tara:strand:- start:121 stop:978 length:858 start_codon:yes stop_codon:yes gene_type:complete